MPLPRTITGYRFLTKDPVIDLFREAVRKSGRKFKEISLDSGVTVQTLRRWDFGRTKKPQHLTLTAAMAACGFREVWQNGDTTLQINYLKQAAKVQRRRSGRNLRLVA